MKRLFTSLAVGALFVGSQVMAGEFSKLEQLITDLNKHDKAMMAVSVRENGKIIYEKYEGLASLEAKTQVSKDSKYRIGSISKVYTAVLTMMAVEEGKLKLSDTLAAFFAQIPNSDKITIEHLLAHRSGLFNFTNDPNYTSYMEEGKTRTEMLDIIKNYESDFAPGEKHEYSNSNYILLSLILEKVYNKELALLLQEKIAKPLNLKNTLLATDAKLADKEVQSFRYQDGWQAMPVTHMSIPMGAGAVVSTPRDVSQFMTDLFNGKLVSKSTLENMTQMRDGYGLGLMTFPFHNTLAKGHGGAIDGFRSNAAYIEDDKLAITVISNGLNFNMNEVLIALLSSYYDKPFDLPDFETKAIQLAGDKLESFVGEFESQQLPMDIKMFIEQDTLMAQATGQGAIPMTPFPGNEFRFAPAGIVVKFEAEKGSFMLLQGGGKFKFTRKL